MIIGILSDTHGQNKIAARAINMLQAAGAQSFIHCGDVGDDESVLNEMAGLQVWFVWGNNDWDREALAQYASRAGLNCCDEQCRLTLDGKNIAVTHGDDSALLRSLLEEQTLDYVFTGHTHHAHDKTFGKTRWINPGALHRARPKTAATLDLTTGELTLLTIEK